MLVPRTRLILWVAVIVLPFAAVAGTLPGAGGFAVLFIGGLLAAAGVDAWLARAVLIGLRVELPELVRLQKDRAGELEVRIRNDGKRARPVRIGLAFPPEFAVAEHERMVLLPPHATLAQLPWECTPQRRGQ